MNSLVIFFSFDSKVQADKPSQFSKKFNYWNVWHHALLLTTVSKVPWTLDNIVCFARHELYFTHKIKNYQKKDKNFRNRNADWQKKSKVMIIDLETVTGFLFLFLFWEPTRFLILFLAVGRYNPKLFLSSRLKSVKRLWLWNLKSLK